MLEARICLRCRDLLRSSVYQSRRFGVRSNAGVIVGSYRSFSSLGAQGTRHKYTNTERLAIDRFKNVVSPERHQVVQSGYVRKSSTQGKEQQSPQHEASKSLTAKPSIVTTTRDLRERMKERLATLNPHENIYTLPNILTFSRLLAAPAVGYLVLHDQHVWAVALFAYAGITDLVDGWIARRWQLQTVVGSVIDPMADKALMAILVGCLAIKGALPLWLAVVIFGRDMSLGFAAIYYRYASLPAPKTFIRYWDFSIPSAEVHPTNVSKYNTFLQLILIGATTTVPILTNGMLPGGLTTTNVQQAVVGMQYLVAATTIWSGASYIWRKDVVKILGDDEELKKKQGFRGRAIIGISFAAFTGLAIWLANKESPDRAENETQDS